MRLLAIDIAPDGNLITIGGRNSQGKSSVLNSIAMALGGAAMCPSEPIRDGETEAKVTVTLDDLIVTRRFTREQVNVETSGPKQWSETKSTLSVTNKEGARYPSPQAVLDKLLGALTFDPLAFSKDDPKRQAETLRKLVNLDTTKFDTQRTNAAAKRALLKREHQTRLAQLEGMSLHKDVPSSTLSIEMIVKELEAAEQARRAADDCYKQVTEHQTRLDVITRSKDAAVRYADAIELKIRDLQVDLLAKHDEITAYQRELDKKNEQLQVMQKLAKDAIAAVPDTAPIRQRIAEAESINNRVRQNEQRAAKATEIEQLQEQIQKQDDAVKSSDEAKRKALEVVKFPVAGLSLSDDTVTFNGIPFSQASSSEQLHASVAIGLALNPKLKVLLVRNGNLLDEDHLALLAKQAEESDAQVWMEYVSKDAGGVSVFIEEGQVKA